MAIRYKLSIMLMMAVFLPLLASRSVFKFYSGRTQDLTAQATNALATAEELSNQTSHRKQRLQHFILKPEHEIGQHLANRTSGAETYRSTKIQSTIGRDA